MMPPKQAPPPLAESQGTEPGSRVTLRSQPQGFSVVTTQAVEPGQFLLVFEGTLECAPDRHTLQVGLEQHLASSDPKATWKFINHSCTPNCRIEFGVGPGPARLVTRVPLAPGEEVTFDYLTTEWDLATPFPCACGAPSCVGLVRGARHLDESRLTALAPDLAPHIQALLRSTGRGPSVLPLQDHRQRAVP